MYIKKDKAKILLLIALTIILVILIILLISPQKAFAKYLYSTNYSGNATIAKPIFIVERSEKCKISAINNIGYYEFSIKNYNDSEVSDVGFVYNIEVLADLDESIKFELYKDGKQINLENLKTENTRIRGKIKKEIKYKLKVTYDSNLGTKGKDILQDIQVKVHSEQEKVG